MRIFVYLLYIFSYFTAGFLVGASPVADESSLKKVTFKDVDLDKTYPPNPPVTHRVIFTIEYTDPETSKLETGEVTIELYGTLVSKTVKNFEALCVGMQFQFSNGGDSEIHKASFRNSIFHKIIANKLIQGGDVFQNHADLSIYGQHWPDEDFSLKHDRPGRLSMYNTGPDRQGSQFFITTDIEPATEFDSKNVVFGQVVSGLAFLIDKLQYVPVDSSMKPVNPVVIKYSTVDELSLGNKDILHEEYLERLERYSRGELQEGVTLKAVLENGNIVEKEMEEQQFSETRNPLRHVVIGIVCLLSIYLLAKYKRFLIPRSSKIVSMRHQ